MNEFLWQVHIDWLTASITGGWGDGGTMVGDVSEGESVALDVLFTLGFPVDDGVVRVRPDFGYAYGYVHSVTGLRVDVGRNLATQGLKVTASGKTLHAMDSATDFYRLVLALGFKPTRLDIAYDLFNSGWTPAELHADLAVMEKGRPAYKTQFIESRSGATLTRGSRSSQKYVRFYDKGREQGTPGDWQRIEIEYKGLFLQENADVLAADITACLDDIGDLLTIVKPLIWIELWNGRGGATTSRVSGVLDSATSKMRWLEKSVMPTLVRLFHEDKRQWDEFTRKLDAMIAGMDSADEV